MRRILLLISALAMIAALVVLRARARDVAFFSLGALPRSSLPARSEFPAGPAPDFDGTIPAARASAEQSPARPSATVAAGEAVTIRLSEAPARWYGRAGTTDNERYYRGLVRKLSGGRARLSANLGRAAREFVFAYTELGREPPSHVRDFLIRSSGAVAGDTSFRHVRTSSDGRRALQRAIRAVLRDPPDGDGVVVVGIGEVFTPGAEYARHIGVVATRLGVELDPAPRSVRFGATWRITGHFLEPYRDLHVLAMGPGGEVRTLEPRLSEDRFTLEVPAGLRPGSLDVQLVGVGPRGPGKLFQLRAEIGRNLPDLLVARLPPDETGLRDADAAAELAFSLLNQDRRRHGLSDLIADESLADVAVAHSRDMRDHHFFAHRSPTTGLHTDRLRASGYRAVASAENLALNVGIWEAERGLMASLGHRRNILSKDCTRVGVGVVGEEREDGSRRWWVTQLFARPAVEIDVAEARSRLLGAISRERRRAGLADLRLDASLAEVADAAATEVLDGELEGASEQMLRTCRGRGLLRGRMRAWAASTPEIEKLKLPEMVRAAAAARIGIGIVPGRGEQVLIGVALLVGD